MGWRGAERGLTTSQYRVSFGDEENVLKLEHLELELECCTTLSLYQKHKTLYFKMVNLMAYEPYFYKEI